MTYRLNMTLPRVELRADDLPALRERSPLDAVYGAQLVQHVRARDRRVADGKLIRLLDCSRWRNDQGYFGTLANAGTVLEGAGPNGSDAVEWLGLAGQNLWTVGLFRGAPAGRYLQLHMLIEVMTPASPPAAAAGERYFYAADITGRTLVAMRINTSLAPDTIDAIHTTGAPTLEVTAGAGVTRSAFYVYSATCAPGEPVRLRRDGTVLASSAGNVAATEADLASVRLPSHSGDPSRIKLVESVLVALTAAETTEQRDGRIEYYLNTYGKTVTA